MSALVVDTSSWISYFAGAGSLAVEEALAEGRLFLPPIVAAELTGGRLSTRQFTDLRALLDDLPLCVTDLEHWVRVGRLRASLLAKGFSVSTPDAHVAQCAIDLKGELLTEDGIFRKIAGRCGLRLR